VQEKMDIPKFKIPFINQEQKSNERIDLSTDVTKDYDLKKTSN